MKNNKLITIAVLSLLLGLTAMQSKTITANSVNTILITEVAAYETSDLEWIEIYNPNDTEIDLSGLIFFENETNHTTSFMNNSILKPKTFGLIVNKYDKFIEKHSSLESTDILIIDSTWQSLSESGETISLILNDQKIEEISFPETAEQKSLQREYINENFTNSWTVSIQENSILQVGQNENQNNDEQKNDTSCPAPEIITEYITEKIETKLPFVVLSEISIKDETNDWIELYINTFEEQINQSDIKIIIDNKNINTLKDTTVLNSFLTIDTDLVGTTEQIQINYKNKPVDSVCWSNKSPSKSEEEETQNLISNNLWDGECIDSEAIENGYSIVRTNFLNETPSLKNWTLSPTPTKESENKIINNPPTAKIEIQSGKTKNEIPLTINLDGSQSVDPENQKLLYKWDFGNGENSQKENPPSITYENPGIYLINLTVTDPFGLSSNSSIQIEATEPDPKIQSNTINETQTQQNNIETTLEPITNNNYVIQIASFYPNPKGADTEKEWIEIINLSKVTANLDGWQIDDIEGQSKAFTLNNISIKPNEKYKIYDSDSGITLNNNNDQIRIIKPNGEISHGVSYSNPKENEIFEVINNEWVRFIETSETEIQTGFFEQLPGDDPMPNETKEPNIETTGQINLKLELTELFPNPEGTDKGQEWIEIYNPTTIDTDLTNWKLKINDKSTSLDGNTAKANSYTQIFIKDSLPNSNNQFALLDPKNNNLDSFSYLSAKENESYIKNDVGEWTWTKHVTPGAKNPTNVEIQGIVKDLDVNSQTLTVNNQTLSYSNKSLSNQLKENYEVILDVIEYNNKLEIVEIFAIRKPETQNSKKTDPIIFIIPIILATGLIFRKKLKNLILNKF